MKKTCLVILSALLFLMLSGKELEVIPVTRTPVIDGKLDDACWKQGKWHSDFTVLSPENRPAKEQTRFKAAADENGLYFAVSCDDSAVKAAEKPHDTGFSSDDCLELFLVPDEKIPGDPNIRIYYHFLMNASGSRTELFSRGGVGNVKWNCRWQGKTSRTATGWDAELFIPFCAFHKPSAGTWRFNLGRGNPDLSGTFPGKAELSTWSPMAFYRDLDRFAKLNGLQFDSSRFDVEISDLQISPSFVNGRIQTGITGKFRYHAGKPLMINCLVSGQEILSEYRFTDAGQQRHPVPDTLRSQPVGTVCHSAVGTGFQGHGVLHGTGKGIEPGSRYDQNASALPSIGHLFQIPR